MPTYDYVCKACGKEMEIFQKMSDAKLTKCPECGKEKLIRKIGAGTGIIFHGTGYYCTDFKNKSSSKK
jgi:putative FmdB family regulatory protein